MLCVTGDARAWGVRPDVTQVFDLDGPRLAAIAAREGLVVAVPESPDAPPVDLRPRRVREKERAGANCIVITSVRRLDSTIRVRSTGDGSDGALHRRSGCVHR